VARIDVVYRPRWFESRDHSGKKAAGGDALLSDYNAAMNRNRLLARLDARFPSRRALVTGGASGLGLAVAETLAVRGWRLGLLDLDAPRLEAAAARLSGAGAAAVWTRAVDTRDEASVKAAVDVFAAEQGGLDMAFNSAGVAVAGRFLETPAQDWEWVIAINVLGVAASCRAELPHMIAGGGGLIVNVASAAGFVSGADMSAYNASKAAVIALSETLAQEYARQGIQVTVAMPGFFRTRLLEQARAPAAALGTARKIMHASNLEADAVAREILARAAVGEEHVVLPREYRWLWRFKRLSPKAFQRFMVRFREKKEIAARASRDG
jgi:NAD(P)-dependent dehydrogenase (short-subunit alcohol dehydrogenase family)